MNLIKQNQSIVCMIILIIVVFIIFSFFYKNSNKYNTYNANIMVFFDFNKYESNQQNIMMLQRYFSNRKKQYNHISIVGHADPVGDEKINMRFGYLRSLDVMQWLNQIGVNADEFIIISKGHSDPINDGSDPKLNRRVGIYLS